MEIPEEDPWETLPPEMQVNIALRLKPADLLSLCLTSATLAATLCQDPKFWKDKYRKDFDSKSPWDPALSWKENYRLVSQSTTLSSLPLKTLPGVGDLLFFSFPVVRAFRYWNAFGESKWCTWNQPLTLYEIVFGDVIQVQAAQLPFFLDAGTKSFFEQSTQKNLLLESDMIFEPVPEELRAIYANEYDLSYAPDFMATEGFRAPLLSNVFVFLSPEEDTVLLYSETEDRMISAGMLYAPFSETEIFVDPRILPLTKENVDFLHSLRREELSRTEGVMAWFDVSGADLNLVDVEATFLLDIRKTPVTLKQFRDNGLLLRINSVYTEQTDWDVYYTVGSFPFQLWDSVGAWRETKQDFFQEYLGENRRAYVSSTL